MSAIIIKGGEATKHKVTQLFDPVSIVQLTKAITLAIGRSYETHKMRNPTAAETRRRFELIMKNVLELRGDRKWGVQRVCDSLGDILRAELSGQKYQPDDKRTVWVPTDGA